MAFARGKVILAGEHAVVYGAPALAASLERGVHAQASVGDASMLDLDPWQKRVVPDARAEEPLSRAFAALLEQRPSSASPAHVQVRIELPAGAGLGCSAAIGVAIVRSLAELDGTVLDDGAAAEQSLAWERVFHGTPSGVDSAMAAGRGVAWFEKGKPLEAVRLARALHLVVADTGEASSTKGMVDSVRRQWEHDRARTEQVFEGITAVARNARLALEAGDLHGLGRLFDLNHTLLSALLLSTSDIESIVGAARAAGALGAKLTGAGGGGCVLALARNGEEASSLSEALAGRAKNVFSVEVTP